MPKFSIVGTLACAVLLMSACGSKNDDSSQAANPVKSLNVVSVVTVATTAPARTGAPGNQRDLTFATDIDGHHFDIPLTRQQFEARQQNYAGRYFYDLQSKCLDADCATLAVGMTVWVYGGSPADVYPYQQEFVKVTVADGTLNQPVKKSGTGMKVATVDDYLAGRLE